jgi:uroporphyrinogen-III decarboxylase
MDKYVHMSTNAQGEEQGASVALEMKLQVVVNYLIWSANTRLGSYAEAVLAFNHWAGYLSSSHFNPFYMKG